MDEIPHFVRDDTVDTLGMKLLMVSERVLMMDSV